MAEATKKESNKLKVASQFYYGTGKRKSAISKVWLFEGKGEFTINGKDLLEHFGSQLLVDKVKAPLSKVGLLGKYSCVIKTLGGGIVGQSGAAVLGVSRAILQLNPEFRKTLKDESMLTRDPRVKERKKYGRKKARKGYQFRKR